MSVERITVLCFAASYGVAFVLDVLRLLGPRTILRLAGLGFALAGLLAHTLFLAVQQPALSSPQGSLLFLAWILAVFHVLGTLHHPKIIWGLFVLPLVLGLIGLAVLIPASSANTQDLWLLRLFTPDGEHFWGAVHGLLLLLAAVGVCVGFLASVMYLVQAHRLKSKVSPNQGLRLLSLERLENMNRRAIDLAFPLLTAGVIIGMALMVHDVPQLRGWTDPRVLTSAVLWLAFAILLYLRLGLHLRGRRVALLTILAFVLLLATLVVPHTLSGGGGP